MPVLTTTEKAGYDASVVKTNTLSGTNTGDQDLSGKADLSHTHLEVDLTVDKYSQAAVDGLIVNNIDSDITGLTGATQVDNYVVITQAGYDAIVTKDPNTVYDVY